MHVCEGNPLPSRVLRNTRGEDILKRASSVELLSADFPGSHTGHGLWNEAQNVRRRKSRIGWQNTVLCHLEPHRHGTACHGLLQCAQSRWRLLPGHQKCNEWTACPNRGKWTLPAKDLTLATQIKHMSSNLRLPTQVEISSTSRRGSRRPRVPIRQQVKAFSVYSFR